MVNKRKSICLRENNLYFSVICRTNYEANEPIKKLECGHLFHSECVANWLVTTGICPVCRRRISPAN